MDVLHTISVTESGFVYIGCIVVAFTPAIMNESTADADASVDVSKLYI